MPHWTEESVDDFENKLSFDFITQLAKKMESLPLTRAEVAAKLDVTQGRVSQIFNNPGNLTLKKMVKYARALGMKVAVVAYDDGDIHNERGPVNSEIFTSCWHKLGKPTDFWSINNQLPRDIHLIGTLSTRPDPYFTQNMPTSLILGIGLGANMFTALQKEPLEAETIFGIPLVI